VAGFRPSRAVLKGENPADLPVQQSTKAELSGAGATHPNAVHRPGVENGGPSRILFMGAETSPEKR
jgi:hypothetical protein